ncbi:MAG: chromosome segregation protein SMC [Clostridia bacterium]|nr:chromosome segregation protein SMC [Clostridia bacterium]
MYFKRLEMHGFKSFAEPVTVEFDDGITCIVGPNGSGKSNISDAIRWVLGEQSSKMLRGDKMEDVIFSGTASRKSRGMAEVTLVIDNSTGILPIEYNEVAITRRMFRSGESEYLINSNHCRLKDIRELIMDTGIGVDGYSIIGQGKIADIVGNKPESRREIFEEAAGIVMYKSKKAEAERKLESTNINLDRVNDIIQEIEDRIGGLREDSIKAKEFLELRDRYKELEINITLKNIDSLDLKLEEMKDDIMELGLNLSNSKERREALDKRISEDRQHAENLQSLSNKAKEDLVTKINELNLLTNQDQLNSERISAIDRDIERLTSEVEELKKKISLEEGNKDSLNTSIKEIETELEDVNDALSAHIDYFNQVNAQAIDLLSQVESNKTKLFNMNTDLVSKQGEIKSMENLKDTLSQRKTELAKSKDELKDTKDKLLEDIKKEEETKANLSKDIEEIKNEGRSLVDRQNDLLVGQNNLRKELDDNRIKLSQMSSRMKTIQEMENNYEGYGYAVKHVMKSGLKGIEGVVADLMKVPAGLEVAIETALGSSLQNIICKDDESAKAAVESLKANKAGRLTFLPLSSIKGRKADAKFGAGFKGVAKDLISCEGKYDEIFSYLLSKVAIFETMDDAIKASKNNHAGFRLVTLDGEIINVSGAITGGKYKNNTANLLERKAEVVKLTENIASLEKEISLKEKELKDNEETIAKVREDISAKTNELRDKEILLATSENTLSSLISQKEGQDEAASKFERDLTNVENDFSNADLMIAKIEDEIKAFEKDIEDTNSKIDEGLANYEQAKKETDDASEEITKARIQQTELNNKKDGISNILERIENQISDYQFQADSKEDEMDSLAKEKSTLMFGSGDAEKLASDKMKEKEDLEGYIKEVDKEIAELTNTVREQDENLQALNGNISSFADQKYELEIKLAKGETQLEGYKAKLWDEFEISYVQAMDFRKKDFVMSSALKESRQIKARMKELGEVNIGAIKEYDQVGERYEFLTEQRADVEKAKAELESIISDMETTIKARFKENFDQVVVHFEEIFKELFGGGYAELRLEDPENPLETGIEIVAQPPGKKLQNIKLLSGGEKTMTAIALMFAVLKTKPTPFCILDEVEAALDEANIDRFANYLKHFNEIQFALITHQKTTMEHADVLYGVTMPERGISKLLSLKLEDDFEI